MTIDEVIRLGEIATSDIPPSKFLTAYGIGMTIALGVFLLMSFKESFKKYASVGIFLLVALSILVVGADSLIVSEIREKKNPIEKRVQDWKQEIVEPFLKNQSQQKALIEHVYETERNNKTVLTLILNIDGTIVSEADNYTIVEQPENTQPYLTYVQVDKDLGPDYPKGRYHKVLHLPKGYKFNTPSKSN